MDILALFDDKKVRTHFDDKKQEWYFSAEDISRLLYDKKSSKVACLDWLLLKNHLKNEKGELLLSPKRIWLFGADGKKRLADVLDTEQVSKLVKAVPSPKTEQIKDWLIQICNKQAEYVSPEVGFNRLFDAYRKKGYSNEWIVRRVRSIVTREDYEKELRKAGVMHHLEYAELTNEMLRGWSGMTIKEYKEYKKLQGKENLRDNMSRSELIINTLGEETATQISREEYPRGFEKSKRIAVRGGNAAYAVRKQMTLKTGRDVLMPYGYAASKRIDSLTENEKTR